MYNHYQFVLQKKILEHFLSICSLELHAHTFNCFCVWSTLLSQFSGDVYSYFSEYRDQAGACQSCTIESCEICGNATECVTCYPYATKYHQGCVSECPNNTFLNVRERALRVKRSVLSEFRYCCEYRNLKVKILDWSYLILFSE